MGRQTSNAHGKGVLGLKLGVDVSLVLGEELGLELDVSRLVDTVDVSEGGGDGESGGDGGERVVDLEDVLRLRVEGRVINTYSAKSLVQALEGREQKRSAYCCCRLRPPLHP